MPWLSREEDLASSVVKRRSTSSLSQVPGKPATKTACLVFLPSRCGRLAAGGGPPAPPRCRRCCRRALQ
eukprot:4215012-Pyramimonas_sp.AAC.1